MPKPPRAKGNVEENEELEVDKLEQDGLVEEDVDDDDNLDEQPEAKAEKTTANKSDSKTSNANVVHGDLDATRLYLNEIGFSALLRPRKKSIFLVRLYGEMKVLESV